MSLHAALPVAHVIAQRLEAVYLLPKTWQHPFLEREDVPPTVPPAYLKDIPVGVQRIGQQDQRQSGIQLLEPARQAVKGLELAVLLFTDVLRVAEPFRSQ